MRVHCSPNPVPVPAEEGVAFTLWGMPSHPDFGRVGASIPASVVRKRMRPSGRAWDFLALALGVIAADQTCLRQKSPDGWTRQIHLQVAVVEREVWSTQRNAVEKALRYLTGDIWHVEFIEGGSHPPRMSTWTMRSRRPPSGDCVCLLSGGMDSLIGAIDLVSSGRTPAFVSQTARGDAEKQRLFSATVGPGLSHVQLNHDAVPPGQSERSQRARSIIFLALATITASSLPAYRQGRPIEVYLPENGFISLNVPLTPLRRGSLSTRTTHPFFINAIQEVLEVLGINIELKNPYQFRTKGEMLERCSDQALLRRLALTSTSCGKFGRHGYRHCGRCVPCLVRRAAIARWGIADTTGYVFDDLSISDQQHRHYDDVRSVAYAAHVVASSGVDEWAGSALSHAELGDVGPFASVAERGIAELRSFLATAGAL